MACPYQVESKNVAIKSGRLMLSHIQAWRPKEAERIIKGFEQHMQVS
jgi:hypothetical protein